MSDWEDDNDSVPRKQPPPQTNGTHVAVRRKNVHFGMRFARRERTDEREAREPAKGDPGRAFQQNRGSRDEAGGRARPLVFNVEKHSAGRIIGELQLLQLT